MPVISRQAISGWPDCVAFETLPAASPRTSRERMVAFWWMTTGIECSFVEPLDEGLRFTRGLEDIAIREPIVKSSADLPPELHEMLERTGVGHLTNPETTPNGIEVFAICEKRETKTDAPAVRQVRQEMFKEQFQAKSKRFLDQLRRQALIEMK